MYICNVYLYGCVFARRSHGVVSLGLSPEVRILTDHPRDKEPLTISDIRMQQEDNSDSDDYANSDN